MYLCERVSEPKSVQMLLENESEEFVIAEGLMCEKREKPNTEQYKREK